LHQENFSHKAVTRDLYFIWSDSDLESRFNGRAAALKNMLQSPNSLLHKKSYTVLKPVQNIISQYDKQADYTTLQGSELQHVLHQELLDLYEQSAQLPNTAVFYKEQIAHTGALAREANENGSVLFASQILDYGWTLLEFGKSVALGVKDGVVNVAKAVIHPIDTLTDMVHGVLQIAQLSLAGIKEAGCFSYDAAVNKEQMYARIDNYRNTTQQFCASISEIPTQELIRRTTAFLTEAIILHRAFKALPQVKQLAKQSSQNAVNYIQKTRQAIEQSRTATTVTIEGIKLPAAQYFEQMVSEIEATQSKTGGKQRSILVGTAEKFVSAKEELPLLNEKFHKVLKGYGPFEGQRNSIDLEHIFKYNLISDKNGKFVNFTGFHHDPCFVIAKAQMMDGIQLPLLRKKNNIAGTYQIIFQGKHRDIPKSFFPSEWSREQVVRKIVEAHKNAQRSCSGFVLEKNGNFTLFGETKEKIVVKMVFDKVGTMITAYPLLD